MLSPQELIRQSVVAPANQISGVSDSIVLNFASVADDMPAWGASVRYRDNALRKFWPSENNLASAMFTVASKYAALKLKFAGPERTVGIVDKMFHGFEFRQGYSMMVMKFLTDLFSTDNGGFLELVRGEDKPTSPCISMNHLDSGRCLRTGDPEAPVKYQSIDGKYHTMKWYQVVAATEFPSPSEDARGIQYCAVTRLLRAAQIMRDISIYKREKVSGRFTRAIHLVSGVQSKQLQDVLLQQKELYDAAGVIRYIQPIIIAGLDPNANIGHEVIEMASLPDGFDEEATMRWYINQMALAFGGDYQDFAPLPGGNLGTASQSNVLHLKSRGKGPATFMDIMEHIFNYCGVLPPTVKMSFEEQDISADGEKQALRQNRAVERDMRIKNGEITLEVARIMAHDVGDLTDDEFELLKNAPDVMPGSQASDPGTTLGGHGVSTNGGSPTLVGGAKPD